MATGWAHEGAVLDQRGPDVAAEALQETGEGAAFGFQARHGVAAEFGGDGRRVGGGGVTGGVNEQGFFQAPRVDESNDCTFRIRRTVRVRGHLDFAVDSLSPVNAEGDIH